MVKFNPKLKWGIYYKNDLHYSEAFQSLTLSARNLLHCLMSEVNVRLGKGRNRKETYYPNNGEISLTQSQFTGYFGCPKTTYTTARNQLIEVGCIKMTYRGGLGTGDMAKYKILTLSQIPVEQQRWRKYPETNWSNEIPKSKKQLIGLKTQWKKGESGRKIKPTLNN